MCLQVVIAALYYNPELLFQTMEKLQMQMSPSESITAHFVKQWIHDTDCFLGYSSRLCSHYWCMEVVLNTLYLFISYFRLHDRKLCVLGLCTLLSMGQGRPPVLNECVNQIMPSMILLFDGLKRAYAGMSSWPVLTKIILRQIVIILTSIYLCSQSTRGRGRRGRWRRIWYWKWQVLCISAFPSSWK